MTNQPNHVIVTKKVIYEAKAVSVPTQETRDSFIRAGLNRRNGQWEGYSADSVLMTEAEAKAFFDRQVAETVAATNAA